jgi:hypothetical protein
VIDENKGQLQKHPAPRISTFLGIMIDWSDEHENTDDLIRVKCEFDSNRMKWWLQSRFRITIEFGIQRVT